MQLPVGALPLVGHDRPRDPKRGWGRGDVDIAATNRKDLADQAKRQPKHRLVTRRVTGDSLEIQTPGEACSQALIRAAAESEMTSWAWYLS